MKNIIIALTSFVLVISCASKQGSYLTDEEIIEKYVEKEYKTLAYECWLRSSIGGSDKVIRMPKGTKLEILDKGNDTTPLKNIYYKVSYKRKVGWVSEHNF